MVIQNNSHIVYHMFAKIAIDSGLKPLFIT
nr:MAG TPA: hypothetical protein [Caudoviricetes sp.]